MKTWRGAAWATALVVVGLSGTTANASWCNAFEVCWHRNQNTTSQYYAPPASVAYYVAPPVTSYYAPPPTTSCYEPPAACTPCQTCQTNYVQRSYYQPVTEYQSQSYYEKVTSVSTSYYYAPVQSYSYSSFYDASSCSYQQVAKPTVSYQLRAQSCPVDSWVQRCQKVPVTSYKIAYYYDPVTTCSAPPPAPAPACNSCSSSAPPGPVAPQPQPSNYLPPENKWQPPPAGVNESTRSPGALPYDRSYPPTTNENMPRASGSSYQPNRQGGVQAAPVVSPAPAVHLDRFTSAPSGQITGQVVQANWQPATATRLVFINADRQDARKEVATDNLGRFQAQLASGGWLVYVEDAQRKPVFSQKIDVRANDKNELLRLVSR
jgi:hypothetical protein